MNNFRSHGFKCAAAGRSLLWTLAAALILCGCSSASYRRSADKEVYGIIQSGEKMVTGHTNAFTIDTPYSSRKPAEILPAELVENRLQTNQRLLTIEAALDLAVKNSREYQTQKETLYKAALALTGVQYSAGHVTGASTTAAVANREEEKISVLVGTNHVTRTQYGSGAVSITNGVDFSQLLATGGRLTASALNSIMLFYSGKPEVAFSRISTRLIQPLLRGFGANSLEVEALTQAERDVVYEVRNFTFYQDQFAMRIANDYFGLLAQKDVIRNRYTNYLGRAQATRRLEARAKDRERLSDVDQARQAELTAKNNYVNAVAGYRTSLDRFKITLGLPVSEKLTLDDQVLDEMEQTGLVPVQLDSDAAYHLAVQRQLQILNSTDQFEDSKRNVRVYADRLKAGLTFSAGASLQSEGTDYTKFDADKVKADVGLQLDLPFDRLLQRNDYRKAVIAFEAELRDFTRTLDNLKFSIDNGLATLEQRRQNYEIQKSALQLADRRVASTTLLQQAGRAEVRDLVDALDAQIAAQNAVTSALVDYQTTRLQLMLDIGALDTELPRFWLKDHLAAFLPGGTPIPVPALSADQAVLPPEQYFKN